MITQDKVFATTAGFDNSKQVEALDEKYGIPNDYKQFLLKNDCVHMEDHLFKSGTEYTGEELEFSLKLLYGYGDESSKYNVLETITDEYADEMPEKWLIIGDCYVGNSLDIGLVVLNCQNREILVWDDTHSLEISNDNSNVYKVADSFTEFIDKLEALELTEEEEAEIDQKVAKYKEKQQKILETEPYLLKREYIMHTGEDFDNSFEVDVLDQRYGLPEDYKKFLLKHDYVRCHGEGIILPLNYEGKTYKLHITLLFGFSEKSYRTILSEVVRYRKTLKDRWLPIAEGNGLFILDCATDEVIFYDADGNLNFYQGVPEEIKLFKIADSFTEFINLLKPRYLENFEDNMPDWLEV